MINAKSLLQLQDIERQIVSAQTRIRELDAEIGTDERVQAAQTALQAAQEVLPPLQKQIRSYELDLDETRTKAEATEARLYSGSVKNPKELQEMQQEIAALKQKQSDLEETMLTVMEQAEAAEATIEARQADLETANRAVQDRFNLLTGERDHKIAQLDTLKSQRAATLEQLSADELELYEQLKPRTRGLPVAKMSNDGTCGTCGVQQNQNAQSIIRRGTLGQCSNCRRILVFL